MDGWVIVERICVVCLLCDKLVEAKQFQGRKVKGCRDHCVGHIGLSTMGVLATAYAFSRDYTIMLPVQISLTMAVFFGLTS